MKASYRVEPSTDGSSTGPHELERLFNPRSIAVVGASTHPDRPAGRPLRLLVRDEYGGDLYPVNPHAEKIAGLTCYPDIRSLPQGIDVAILLVPASKVRDALLGCVDRQMSFGVIIASGFAEAGNLSGQDSLLEVARRGGMRLVGPNSVGLINPFSGVTATFNSRIAASAVQAGGLAILSQGGALGSSIVEGCRSRGVGIRAWVSTGNEVDLGLLDFADYFVQDDSCLCVSTVVEGFKNPAQLVRLGRRAADAGKPFVVLRTTLSDRGRAAALSHTGKLAGSTQVWRGIREQAGLIEVRSPEELIDVSCSAITFATTSGAR